jgi:hypothetical protein
MKNPENVGQSLNSRAFEDGLRPELVDSINSLKHPLSIALDSILHPEDLAQQVLYPTMFYASS